MGPTALVPVLTEGAGETSKVELLFLFFIVTVTLGVFFKFFQKYVHYEFTPLLLIIGIIFGFFADGLGKLGEALKYVGTIDGHALLLIFIPLLIYESAFSSHTHTFLKSIWQILILAFPAVAMSIGLIAVTIMEVLRYKDRLNWGMGLSLASILAATDPVAVVAILKSTGAQIKLNMLIEGESLMNDGSASIFYFVFADMVLNPSFSFVGFVEKFARLTLGGAALGLGMGIVFSVIMRRLIHSATLLALSSFLACYTTFFLAEASIVGMHVSGILAVVVLGLYLGGTIRPRMSPHSSHSLHEVWVFAQFMMETLLFMLTGSFIGIVLAEESDLFTAADAGKLIALNLLLLFIRFLVQAVWWPLLNLIGYRISWKEYILVSYSGLRGAIGLAIALLVFLNADFVNQLFFREFTVLATSSVIVFTVLLQGSTLKLVMKLVRYNQVSKTKAKLLRDLHRRMFLSMLRKSESIRKHKEISFLVNWAALYEIFRFPKYILKLENLISGSKPLLLDYDDSEDVIGIHVGQMDDLDHLISDDEHDRQEDGPPQETPAQTQPPTLRGSLVREDTDIQLTDQAETTTNLGSEAYRNSCEQWE